MLQKSERLQRQRISNVSIYNFVRNFYLLNSTQNDFVYGELGRYSFQNIRYYKGIKYWIKILRFHETKYVKIVYNALYDDCLNHPNKLSWATLLRDLLSNLGFMDVWIHKT